SHTGEQVRVMFFGSDAYYAFLIPDGSRVASLHRDGRVEVWDSHTGEQVRVLPIGSDADCAALIPDGSRVATLLLDGRVKLWDTATGQEVLALKTRAQRPLGDGGLLFSVDGEKLAVWSWAGNSIEIFGAPRTPALHKFFAGE